MDSFKSAVQLQSVCACLTVGVTKVKPPSESRGLCRTNELFATSKYSVAPPLTFPAQIVEVTDCGEGTIDASAGAGPPSAWRKIRHSSGVCCKASVKVKSPAGGLFAGQLSVDEPEHASNQSGATAMQRTLRMVSSAAYRVRSVFAPANSRPAATRVASAPRER